MTLEASPHQIQLTSQGLYTMPNPLSQVPAGSLLVAENVNVDYDGLLTGRRGIRQYGISLETLTSIATTEVFQEFFYDGSKMIWFGDSTVSTANHYFWAYDSDNLGTWVTTTNPFSPPAYALTETYRYAQSNLNFYLTTTTGILKTDAPANALYPAGGFPGLDGVGSLTGSSGWMMDNTEVAYRMTWATTDANNNTYEGTVSPRVIVTSPAISSSLTSVVSSTEITVASTTGFVNGGTATDVTAARDFVFNITMISGATFTVSSTTGMVVGDTVQQGTASTTIASIGSGTIVVVNATGFTTGAAIDNTPSTTITFTVVTVNSSTDLTISSSAGMAAGDTINALTTSNVSLTFTIPNGVTTKTQYRIYRSLQSASATTDPSDELQLAIEGYVDSTDITNRYFTVTDLTIESNLGTALYTNSGQQGIAQNNNIPPLANDVCFFEGYLIFGAATTQQTFLLSLLAVGSPSGIQVGDTFSVKTGGTTVTLTGASSENVSLAEFEVYTGGTPADNIYNTKLSLIRVLNRQTQTLVYAYDSTSTGSATSLPGDFYLQEQGISRVQFGVASSRSTAWNPALTTTPSDNPSLPGGGLGVGYCSKFQQPEAVPVANEISVGNPAFEWYRCLPLRNSVIVLKADGCFQLTGTSFPFTVTTLDLGTILTAPESATVMSNQVFAYTNQGAVAITETGPGIISRPIENLLQQVSSYLHVNFPKVTFGTAYETDRKWILSTVSGGDNFVQATVQYVYDTITQTWTTYTYPVPLWDLLESPVEHRLYATSASTAYPYVFQERKSFTISDFADIEIPVSISSYVGRIITVSSTAGAKVGWSLAQVDAYSTDNPLRISVITAILDSTHVVVTDLFNWDTSGSQHSAFEQPIPIDVQFCPIIGNADIPTTRGNPNAIKFFQELQVYFQNINFESIEFLFSSDFTSDAVSVSLVPTQQSGGWGQLPWGEGPWGSGGATLQAIRTYVPLQAKRAHWLNLEMQISQAMTQFTFAGLCLTYMPVTTRSK